MHARKQYTKNIQLSNFEISNFLNYGTLFPYLSRVHVCLHSYLMHSWFGRTPLLDV